MMCSFGLGVNPAAHSQISRAAFLIMFLFLQTWSSSRWVSQPPLPWSPSCGRPPEEVIGDSSPHLCAPRPSPACAAWEALPVPSGSALVPYLRGAEAGTLAQAATELEENCPVKSQTVRHMSITHVLCHQYEEISCLLTTLNDILDYIC